MNSSISWGTASNFAAKSRNFETSTDGCWADQTAVFAAQKSKIMLGK